MTSSWFITEGCSRDEEGDAPDPALVSEAAWHVPPGQASPTCPGSAVAVAEVWSPHRLEDLDGHKRAPGRGAALLDVPSVTQGIPQLLGGPLGFSLHSCAMALPKGFLLFCLVLLDYPDVGPGQWQAGACGGALPLCRGVRSSGSPCPCSARANQKPHPLMGRTGHRKAFALFNIPYRNVHVFLLTCVFPHADEADVTGAAEGLPSQRFKTSGGRAAG